MLPFYGVGDGYFMGILLNIMGIWIYNMMIWVWPFLRGGGPLMRIGTDLPVQQPPKICLEELDTWKLWWEGIIFLDILKNMASFWRLTWRPLGPLWPVLLLGLEAAFLDEDAGKNFRIHQHPITLDLLCCQCVFSKQSCRRWEWDGTCFFRRCLTRPLWSNVVNSANFATLWFGFASNNLK